MIFSIEERKENYLIIKAARGNIKTRTIRNLVFSLTLQAVRINNLRELRFQAWLNLYVSFCCRPRANKEGTIVPKVWSNHRGREFSDLSSIRGKIELF